MERLIKPSLLRFVTATLFACVLTACDEIPTSRVLAQVLETKGDAFVLEGSNRRALTTTTPLGSGESVETGENATAMIALMPGMVLQMNGNTSIRIDKLRLVKNGNATVFAMRLRQASVELGRGSMQVTMPVTFAPGELEVVTPAATVIAPETNVFYIGFHDDTLRTVAARGELSVRTKLQAGSKTVSPGYYIDWRADTGDAVSEPRRLESDSEASQQAKEAFEAERRVIALTPRMRNVRPYAWMLKER